MTNLYTNSESGSLDKNESISTPYENRTYLINEDNFKKLQALKQEIFKLKEMTPSIRKLVNSLITSDNLEKLKAKLLQGIND